MTRRILHLDLDAFFCSVEEQRDPTLRGLPFAVGGSPEGRGVVASCSYAARKLGVRSAMPMKLAIRLCPNLKIVSSGYHLYSQASKQVMDIMHSKAPHMEQISIDEAFLDISDLPETSEDFSRQLQSEIREGLGLPCSIGVASNKLVAKIATDYGKSQARGDKPPNAITIVPLGSEAAFLDPLPVVALWGVGPKTAEKLSQLGIQTIGEIARYPAADLTHHFGKHGLDLSTRSRGIDDRPLVGFHEPKSISQERTFPRDIQDHAQLVSTIVKLAERVSKQAHKAGKRGVTVKIKLRWPDFTTLTRQTTLPEPTDQVESISSTALALFEAEWKPGQAVRLIGVGISGFEKTSIQLGLWGHSSSQKVSTKPLDEAVENLRKRFGENVVIKGSQLVHEPPDKKTPG